MLSVSLLTLPSPRTNGLPGNDDSGAMGAYAVWSCMGQSFVRLNKDAVLMLHLQVFILLLVKTLTFSIGRYSQPSLSTTK